MQLGCCGDTGGIQQGIQIVETHAHAIYACKQRRVCVDTRTRRVCGWRARDSTRAPHRTPTHPARRLPQYFPQTVPQRVRARAGTQLRGVFVLCYTTLCCTALHYTALHTLYYTVLHCPQHNSPAEKQMCTTLQRSMLYTLHCTVLYCAALHCRLLTVL